MKKVFNNENLSHVWANKLQNLGKSGSMFIDKDTIYSYGYHFAIAKHYKDIILFTTRSYSNTTAKHINIVRNASQHIEKVYCPYPNGTTNENFEYWAKEAKNITKSLLKAKKPEKYLYELNCISDKVNKYANLLETSIPNELNTLLNITNKESAKDIIEKEQKEIEAKILKDKKEKEKIHKKELSNFRKGLHFNSYNLLHDFAYLRLNEDKTRIETTQRVQIPIMAVERFIKSLKAGLSENLSILDYKLNTYNKNTITIGCHNIEIKEANKILKALNLETL